MQKPPSLEAALRGNLDKTMGSLIQDGEVLSVTDSMLVTVSLSIQVELI
jgi:hypothetical protein